MLKMSLALACEYRDLKLIFELIDKDIDLEKPGINGRTPLIAAVKNRLINVVDKLIEKKVSLDKQDNDGYTALLHATLSFSGINDKFADESLCFKLIDAGCNVNICNNDLTSPLIFTCWTKTFSYKVAEKLIMCGADLNHQNKGGNTALMHLDWHDMDVYKLIYKYISQKPNMNLKNGYDQTFLMILLRSNPFNYNIVRLVLELEQDLNFQDHDGNIIIDYVSGYWLEGLSIALLLFEKGVYFPPDFLICVSHRYCAKKFIEKTLGKRLDDISYSEKVQENLTLLKNEKLPIIEWDRYIFNGIINIISQLDTTPLLDQFISRLHSEKYDSPDLIASFLDQYYDEIVENILIKLIIEGFPLPEMNFLNEKPLTTCCNVLKSRYFKIFWELINSSGPMGISFKSYGDLNLVNIIIEHIF